MICRHLSEGAADLGARRFTAYVVARMVSDFVVIEELDPDLGLEPFRHLLNDRRFAGLPMFIETEKSPDCSKPNVIVADRLDLRNLETLRALRSQRPDEVPAGGTAFAKIRDESPPND